VKLSVIVPVLDEAPIIEWNVEKVHRSSVEKETIAVDGRRVAR
jgi:hypothetical protein